MDSGIANLGSGPATWGQAPFGRKLRLAAIGPFEDEARFETLLG